MKNNTEIKHEPVSLSAYVKVDTLKVGEAIRLPENHIIANKRLTLSFTVDELSEGEIIKLGHGESLYSSHHLELDAKGYKIYEYLTEYSVIAEGEHGLTIKGAVNVIIEVEYGKSRITISTPTGTHISEWRPNTWGGRNGSVFAYSEQKELKDVTLRWYSPDTKKPYWLFGDSYFNPTSAIRWPSYVVSSGYTNFLLSGFPGRDSVSALRDFKELLNYGTPKFAVWCLGMNNHDSDTEISTRYKESTEEFISICRERGIIPVLSTIPNVPKLNHSFKNEFVRSSGCRYIDFARGVGATEVGSPWYPGMLHTDNVHPTATGAMALYAQFITDFPEIME